MHTKLPAFQDALSTVLTPAVTLADAVSLGWPKGGLLPKHVFITGKAEMEVSSSTSGFGSRDEDLKTEIRVWVELATDDYADVRDKVFAIADQIDDAIEADPTLGGVVRFAMITGMRLEEGAENSKRFAGLILTVSADTTVQ